MRHLTALIPLVLLFLLDALCIITLFGIIALVEMDGPFSYRFALKVWCS